MSDREAILENALAQFLQPLRGIPFDVVIRALCRTSVEKFDPSADGNAQVLSLIVAGMRSACLEVQKNPIERPRPNEVGNDLEPFAINGLREKGLNAGPPKTKTEKGKTTGYPDIKIVRDGLPIYVEVKSYAAANHETTQRSFYLSPSEDPKVSVDAHHLLVGFEVQREGNLFWPVAFQIVDLWGLLCDMKAEFNSDNKRLYHPGRVLASERV